MNPMKRSTLLSNFLYKYYLKHLSYLFCIISSLLMFSIYLYDAGLLTTWYEEYCCAALHFPVQKVTFSFPDSNKLIIMIRLAFCSNLCSSSRYQFKLCCLRIFHSCWTDELITDFRMPVIL